MSQRLDQEMMIRGLVKSRSQAKDLIKRSLVAVNGHLAKKTSQTVQPETQIDILAQKIYVSRGAEKIRPVLESWHPQLENQVVLDIGASTGGFTQLCLELGAQKIFAVDVGTNQLDQSLLNDPRVVNWEGVNARYPLELKEKVDLIVIDVSHISLSYLLPLMANYMGDHSQLICLFKPQFEVGKKKLPHDGVVKNSKDVYESLLKLLHQLPDWNLSFLDLLPAGLAGKKGNQEFFLLMECKNNSSEDHLDKLKTFFLEDL